MYSFGKFDLVALQSGVPTFSKVAPIVLGSGMSVIKPKPNLTCVFVTVTFHSTVKGIINMSVVIFLVADLIVST